MPKQFLDEAGLAVVATYVNEKLKVVSTMPATPTNGQVVLYVGATTSTYTQGGIYLYNGTAWVLISTADVDLTPYKKIFTGTRAEWNLLSTAEKKEYDEADLSDDLAGGELIVSDAVTAGDLNPVTSNAVANAINANVRNIIRVYVQGGSYSTNAINLTEYLSNVAGYRVIFVKWNATIANELRTACEFCVSLKNDKYYLNLLWKDEIVDSVTIDDTTGDIIVSTSNASTNNQMWESWLSWCYQTPWFKS